jgi:hypothetical protein
MPRQLTLLALKAAGIPLAVMAVQAAGAAMPIIPAGIIGCGICGAAGYSLFKSLWKLIEEITEN